MQQQKNILILFLLVSYLMAVFHHSIFHTHGEDDICHSKQVESLSHYEGAQNESEDHHFHFGLFHFLGHLFQSVDHSSDHSDNQCIVVLNLSSKKKTTDKTSSTDSISGNFKFYNKKEIYTITNSLFLFSIVQPSVCPSLSPRAPPAFA